MLNILTITNQSFILKATAGSALVLELIYGLNERTGRRGRQVSAVAPFDQRF